MKTKFVTIAIDVSTNEVINAICEAKNEMKFAVVKKAIADYQKKILDKNISCEN
jgi:hypothetical protein